MTRRKLFGRSLAFAALAGVGAIPYMVTFGPYGTVPLSYLLAAAAIYVASLSPRRGRELRVGLGVLAAGALLAWSDPGAAGITSNAGVLGVSVLIAVARSVFFFRTHPTRAVLLEGAVGIVSITLALTIWRESSLPWPLPHALGVWAYFFAQSGFFLIGGRRREEASAPDPFEQSRQQIEALLDPSR